MTNIAELIKDAPKGMKLYSPLFGEVEYMQLGDENKIWVKTSCGTYYFDKYGKPYAFDNAECLLFPSKDCRTWEGWKLPVEPKFKAGDKVLDNMMIVTVREVVYDQNYKEYKYGIGSYWVFESALKPYKPHYDISNFHAGMPVLVRWYDTGRWRYSLYSFYEEDSINTFDTVKGSFTQCIPYNNDTKHLLGTTEMCPEEYINW